MQTPSKTTRFHPRRWAEWVEQIPDFGKMGPEALNIIYNGCGTVTAYEVPFSDIPNHVSCVEFSDRIEKELEWYDKSG